MIDVQREVTGPMLTLDDTKDTTIDLSKQCDEIVDRLLIKDLEYNEDDAESPGKDEPEFEEDIANMDTSPLELEELPDIHEDLTQLPDSPGLETPSILALPRMAPEDVPHTRRVTMRRRRSEDADENAVNTADAGESDAVMTYLREIGRVPMITHEREIELAQRIEMGDREAMKQFILANLRLVVSIAKRYVGRGLTVADKGRTIRLPVYVNTALNRIRRERQRLLQELGREPTEEELAEATGLDPIRMVELQAAPGAPVSLELPVGEDEEQELGDVLADTESASPEDIATTQTLKDEVQRVLEAVLTPRERLVLQLRFGLGNSQAHPLEQVGRELGITRERVRQIEAGALAKLRQPPVLERLRG